MARQLDMGDRFPEYSVRITAGSVLKLPDDLRGEYSALLFYRGIW